MYLDERHSWKKHSFVDWVEHSETQQADNQNQGGTKGRTYEQ